MAPELDSGSGQGLAIALSAGWRIAGGVLAGYWLDRWLETAPLFLILFAVGGFAAVIFDMLRASRPAPRGPEDRDQP